MSVVPSSAFEPLDVILVAPNVSEQMGGEAIKALHIYLELEKKGISVQQVTHSRVKQELDRKFPQMRVTYVYDTVLQKILYRLRMGLFLHLIFTYAARRRVLALLKDKPNAIIHFTSPVSPVLPYPALANAHVVIGPLNGNIHYPRAFRDRETMTYKLRRWFHPFLQFGHRISFSGKRNADALLVAGGRRTYDSLMMAGCKEEQFVDSIDSGVLSRLYETKRATQSGINFRFFHNGRLVKHKGTELIIKSLLLTKHPVELDIIGRGPELERLRALTSSLSLDGRVKFIEWIEDHSKLADMLRQYRGFVFPSLAEANGIVVQEAMVQGLPVVALDWGGPSLLVTPATGVLIQPLGEEHVIQQLAGSLDRLAEDGDLAEKMSIEARARAFRNGYLWPGIIENWINVYRKVSAYPLG